MDHHTTRNRTRSHTRAVLGAIVAAFALAIGVAATPVAAGGGSSRNTVSVSGTALPSDCNDGEGMGALEMTGSLEGCWIFFPDSFSCEELNGFARVQERGREIFRGTVDGDEGTFRTRYTIDAVYNAGTCAVIEAGGPFPFTAQLAGGCEHRVVGGTDVFKRARGLITFFDVIPDPGESGASHFLYAGDLRLKKA